MSETAAVGNLIPAYGCYNTGAAIIAQGGIPIDHGNMTAFQQSDLDAQNRSTNAVLTAAGTAGSDGNSNREVNRVITPGTSRTDIGSFT